MVELDFTISAGGEANQPKPSTKPSDAAKAYANARMKENEAVCTVAYRQPNVCRIYRHILLTRLVLAVIQQIRLAHCHGKLGLEFDKGGGAEICWEASIHLA